MSDKKEIPVFNPPTDDSVPDFLRPGHSKPTYRASGGLDYYNQSSFAPAPLQFNQKNAPALAAFNQPTSTTTDAHWFQQYNKSKSLEHSFKELVVVNDTAIETHLQQSSSKIHDVLDSSDDEQVDNDTVQEFVSFPSITMSTDGNKDIDEVFANMTSVFGSGVDYILEPKALKIRGVISKGRQCHFSVRFVARDNNYVAEFQRRSGCTATFTDFFATTVSKLTRSSFFTRVTSHTPSSDLAATLPAVSTEESAAPEVVQPVLDEASCAQLIDMCSSEFADVQTEALRTLASVAQAATGQLVSQSSNLISVLCKAGQSTDNHTQWYVAQISSVICGDSAFAGSALDLLPVLFFLLSAPTCLQNQATQREAARSVELVARQNRGNLMSVPSMAQYLGVLEAHVQSSDASLQNSIRAIIGHLSA